MAQDGNVSFQPLSVNVFVPGAAPTFSSAWTGTGTAPGGAQTLSALTAAANAPGGAPALAAATATGTGSAASVGAGLASFESATSTGTGSAGSVSAAAPSFESLAGAAYGPQSSSISFAALAASGVGLTGTVAAGDVRWQMSALGASVGGSMSAGTATFQTATARGAAAHEAIVAGAASFLRSTAAAASLNGSVATATVRFAVATASLTSSFRTTATGSAAYQPAAAYAYGSPVLSDAFHGWALNTDSYALTEYQNYGFNSLAEFHGSQWGAGPGGIRRLDGSSDAGTDISWVVRTGLLDGKNAMLKRLDEVLLSIRFDGPIKVRVWTDDDRYYDYTVLNWRPDVVHQVRARLGKGLKSRFFRIELSGQDNTYMELNSMQIPFQKTARRLG